MSQHMTPEFATTYRDLTLDGFRHELETTRKVIAAVPDAKSDYKPDPHARTAKELAWHIAVSEVDFLKSILNLKFEMNAEPETPATIAEILAWHDQKMQPALDRLSAMTAEQLLTPINFVGLFNFPAVVYLGFLNNHSVHHRAALATYLRPMGSKVPSIYGGSYDEPFKMPEPAETAA
jgi:uncharacterized damage-inducible protein DinB